MADKEMDVLYVVMPAYNEEANIEAVVREWYQVLEGKSELSRLVIADAGSTDNTHKILASIKEELPQIDIIENTLKQHGPKLIALYNYAIENGADYIFQTDSDGQTSSKEFGKFWMQREMYDGIFGFRRHRGDGAGRMFVEKVLCAILWFVFGIKVPDANAPYRLMSSKVLKDYMDRFAVDFAIPNVMVVVFFKYYNRRMLFEEITFENRKAGKNSINVSRIVSIGIKSLREFYKFKKDM